MDKVHTLDEQNAKIFYLAFEKWGDPAEVTKTE